MLLDSYLILKAPIPQTSEAMGQGSQSGNNTDERKPFSLPEIIPEGDRDNTLHRYACSLYVKGCSDDEVWYLITKANEERCENPINEEQLTNLYRSAKRQWGNSDERRAKLNRIETIMAFSEAAKEQGQESEELTDVLCLEDLEEVMPEWLIPGYIPKKEITVMAGDGGVGKTFAWCGIAAAVSSGVMPFLLNNSFPDDIPRTPEKVMYFSSEDSNAAILRPRLRANGANLKNIITIDCDDERFQNVTLNSGYLESLLSKYRPALCIFDPLQSFLPRGVSMISRNDMRNSMAKLHVFGKKYGTTFLIIMHTNKKTDVWGRNRLADSSDIWDIARSVLIVGNVDEHGNTKYLSQEKSSYGKRENTVLFRIQDNAANFASYTDKTDRDFVRAASKLQRETPAKDTAEQFILEYLEEHGECLTTDLNEAAKALDITVNAMRSAKESLKAAGKISFRMAADGQGKGVKYYVSSTV